MKKSIVKRPGTSRQKPVKEESSEESDESEEKEVPVKKRVTKTPGKITRKKPVRKESKESKESEESEESEEKEIVKKPVKKTTAKTPKKTAAKKTTVKTPKKSMSHKPEAPVSIEKVLSSLVKKVDDNEGELLTTKQVEALMGLQFSDGVPMLSLDTDESKGFVLDISWLIQKLGFDIVYEFLSKDWEKLLRIPEEASSDYKRARIIRDNPIFSKNRDNLLLELYYFKNPIMISESSVNCIRCGSNETLSTSKQTRSADEPADIRVTCLMCSAHWRAQ